MTSTSNADAAEASDESGNGGDDVGGIVAAIVIIILLVMGTLLILFLKRNKKLKGTSKNPRPITLHEITNQEWTHEQIKAEAFKESDSDLVQNEATHCMGANATHNMLQPNAGAHSTLANASYQVMKPDLGTHKALANTTYESIGGDALYATAHDMDASVRGRSVNNETYSLTTNGALATNPRSNAATNQSHGDLEAEPLYAEAALNNDQEGLYDPAAVNDPNTAVLRRLDGYVLESSSDDMLHRIAEQQYTDVAEISVANASVESALLNTDKGKDFQYQTACSTDTELPVPAPHMPSLLAKTPKDTTAQFPNIDEQSASFASDRDIKHVVTRQRSTTMESQLSTLSSRTESYSTSMHHESRTIHTLLDAEDSNA